jgi:hypothetical protein
MVQGVFVFAQVVALALLNYATPRAFVRDMLLGLAIKALPSYLLLTHGTMEAHVRVIAPTLAIAAM